jgi:hypothetical protein
MSDAITGTILGAVNQVLVEPYIDRAIPIKLIMQSKKVK